MKNVINIACIFLLFSGCDIKLLLAGDQDLENQKPQQTQRVSASFIQIATGLDIPLSEITLGKLSDIAQSISLLSDENEKNFLQNRFTEKLQEICEYNIEFVMNTALLYASYN